MTLRSRQGSLPTELPGIVQQAWATTQTQRKVQQLWSTANSHPSYEMADLLGCGLPETDYKHKEMWI